MKLARVGLLLVLLFITQCLLADARDDQEKSKRRRGKVRSREAAQGRDGDGKAGAPQGQEKKQSKGKSSAPKQGKFVGGNKAECRWTLSGEDTGDRNLRLDCKQGHNDYWCEFTGKPAACPKYADDSRTYWKQVIKVLKKKSDCSDPSAVLKASLCKRTKAAHMKITRSSLLPAAEKDSKASAPFATAEPDNPDIDKIATENCGERWESVCKFMLLAFNG